MIACSLFSSPETKKNRFNSIVLSYIKIEMFEGNHKKNMEGTIGEVISKTRI